MILMSCRDFSDICSMGTRLEIHPQNPQPRFVQQAVSVLEQGGIIIYPTDTVYALGCDIQNKKALERVCQIKGIDPDKALFSCICPDLKTVSEFAVHIGDGVFKMMRRACPGPYTFILEASKNIPKHFQSRRKTVGVRIVDHAITLALVRTLGRPILTTSLPDSGEEYPTDPEEIYELYGKRVDMVIDGGWGGNQASTIIDCSRGDGDIEIVREGLGSLDIL
jgi:tRNA threonylcarbamoyl adenosine modification protein (Sua5/YciO/YrdC/YwlC family)